MTQITVPAVPIEVTYAVTSASTGPFTVPFPFFDEDDVFATVTDALGAVTALVHTTDFTFSVLTVPVGQEGTGYEGGALDLVAAIGADGATTLRIYRSTVIDRTANFPSTGPFSMPILNDEQNQQTMILQELDEKIEDGDAAVTAAYIAADAVVQADVDANELLAVRSPDGGTMLLPNAGSRADSYLKFDSSGDVTIAAGSGSGGTSLAEVQGYMYPITADETTYGYIESELNTQYETGNTRRYPMLKDGVSDDSVELQRYFDFVTAYPVGVAECSGDFATSVGIIVGQPSNASETLVFNGHFKLTALNAIDELLSFQNTGNVYFSGFIHVIGTGGTSFTSRTCRTGVKIAEDPAGSSRMMFDFIRAQQFYEFGVYCSTLSTLTDLGNVRASDCGSGQPPTASFSLETTWSNRSDTGSSGSVAQLSEIEVVTMPPSALEARKFVIINGNVHQITAEDTGASTITVYPWIKANADTSGSLRYLFGGGIYTIGGDSGIIGANMVDATRCGIALFEAALYGAQVARVVTQFCGVGFMFGREGNAAQLGGAVNGLYCEANTFDIVRNTRDNTGRTVTNEYALNLDKIGYSCYAGTSADKTIANLNGICLFYRGRLLQYTRKSKNELDSDSTPDWNVLNPAQAHQVQNRDATTVTIGETDTNINQHFGTGYGTFTVVGSNADGSPTGTITFQPTSAWTVNGGASAAFSGFIGPAHFVCYAIMADENFLVYPTNPT